MRYALVQVGNLDSFHGNPSLLLGVYDDLDEAVAAFDREATANGEHWATDFVLFDLTKTFDLAGPDDQPDHAVRRGWVKW